jgi:hypothetical protein
VGGAPIVLAVVAVLAGAAAPAPSRARWRVFPVGAGGAFNVSVHDLTCDYAARVAEDGLYPGV